MSTTFTRRKVLQFVGGSALGLLFSPIPWKVLDDTAIWTQNWPWIPKGSPGDISYTGATCTLCRSACGMRVRSVGKQPVSTSGIAQHPFNDGALCTMGIVAHHLRYHPARITQPVKLSRTGTTGTPVSSAIIVEEIARLIKASTAPGSIAIVDSRPERTASALFRLLCATTPAMRYIPVSAPSLDVLAAMTDADRGTFAYDIDGAALILNFGAPLFDNWGTPARAASLLDKRSEKKHTIIHIEGLCSRTAERSTQWIAARPGTDALLALSFAHVILAENLVSPSVARTITDLTEFADFVRSFTPEAVSATSGVSPDVIRRTARTFATASSPLAIIGNDAAANARSAVMALNVLIGAIGRTGGVALCSEIPQAPALSHHPYQAVSISDVPDHSLRVIIIDESLSGCLLPDTLLEKKLVPNDGIIVSLSPFVTPRPYCTHYVMPAAVAFETVTDVPGPFDRAVSSLAIAVGVLPAPEGTSDAVQFALTLAQAIGSPIPVTGKTEDIIKERCSTLHASKRGTVYTPSTSTSTEMKSIASADDVWNALAEGGCWIDDAPRTHASGASYALMKPFRENPVYLPKKSDAEGLVVLPFTEMTVYDGTLVSPLLCKVSQESGLRPILHHASINPVTAMAHSIVSGDTVALTTAHGTLHVQATLDASVMPDVLFVSTTGAGTTSASAQQAHDIRAICDNNGSGYMSPTPVTIQKVQA